MKKSLALIVLITFALSLSFSSYGQRNTDIGLSLSSDKEQRFIFEYRKPIQEKWRLTLGAAYGNHTYRYSNVLASFTDTSITLEDYNSHVNKGSLRVGADRQIGNSIFSIGGDILLYYKSTYNTYRNGLAFNIHYLGAGFQITGKMDVPINEKFHLNLFAGPALSVSSSFRIDNIVDPDSQIGFLADQPRITSLDFNLVAGIGLKYALGK